MVRACAERSSYYARNAGAREAPRLALFLDADCAPVPGLLARYFDPPPDESDGLLAGAIADHPEHDSLLARYTRSRNFYRGERGLQASDAAYAPTGNLMVGGEPSRPSVASPKGFVRPATSTSAGGSRRRGGR